MLSGYLRKFIGIAMLAMLALPPRQLDWNLSLQEKRISLFLELFRPFLDTVLRWQRHPC